MDSQKGTLLPDAEFLVEAEASILDSLYVLPMIAVPIFVVLFVILLVKYRKKR